MSSQREKSVPTEEHPNTPEVEKTSTDEALNRLPERFKEQTVREHDLPTTKVTVLDILRWATPFEITLNYIKLYQNLKFYFI